MMVSGNTGACCGTSNMSQQLDTLVRVLCVRHVERTAENGAPMVHAQDSALVSDCMGGRRITDVKDRGVDEKFCWL